MPILSLEAVTNVLESTGLPRSQTLKGASRHTPLHSRGWYLWETTDAGHPSRGRSPYSPPVTELVTIGHYEMFAPLKTRTETENRALGAYQKALEDAGYWVTVDGNRLYVRLGPPRKLKKHEFGAKDPSSRGMRS